MADDQADIDSFLEDEPKKKDSIVPLIIAMVVVSLLAVGAGWFVSGQIKPPPAIDLKKEAKAEPEPEKAAKKGDKPKKDDGDTNYIDGGLTRILKLDPIIVSLAESNGTFLRLEVALVFPKSASTQSEEDRLRIGSELAAFTQTLTIGQISGPSGYMHMREDLLDRARLSTQGAAKDLLILSWVSE